MHVQRNTDANGIVVGRPIVGWSFSISSTAGLLDVAMPELDGFRVCAAIRGDHRFRHLPIVFVTARSDRASRLRGLELGADEFLTKPVDDATLLARVRTLVALKLHREHLESENARLSTAVERERLTRPAKRSPSTETA